MSALDYLDDEIKKLERGGRLRVPGGEAREGDVVACSNDYLGYGGRSRRGIRLGAGGSRLIAGDTEAHRRLERELAEWVGFPAALVFSSGYAANIGVLQALPEKNDILISDGANHASIIDGCRLSRARVVIVDHGDVAAVEDSLRGATDCGRRWVVVESYHSMNGTKAPVGPLRQICDRYGAGLIVDEAHALGIFGPEGRGICAEEGIDADVLVGTFSKALGAQGAFVATTSTGVLWLWNRARTFVYSTGLSPQTCETVRSHVMRVQHDERSRARLGRNVELLRRMLGSFGIAVLEGSTGPIVPVLVGGDERAVAYEQRLRERGIVVRAIRPPTVPEGTARLRVSLSAGMRRRDVVKVAHALRDCAT